MIYHKGRGMIMNHINHIHIYIYINISQLQQLFHNSLVKHCLACPLTFRLTFCWTFVVQQCCMKAIIWSIDSILLCYMATYSGPLVARISPGGLHPRRRAYKSVNMLSVPPPLFHSGVSRSEIFQLYIFIVITHEGTRKYLTDILLL